MSPAVDSIDLRTGDPSLSLFTADVPVQGPYDVGYVVGFLEARAVPGVEYVSDGVYSRTLRLPSGPSVFTATPAATHIAVRGWVRDDDDRAAILVATQQTFDTEVDGVAVTSALSSAAAFRPSAERHAGIRVPRAIDVEELLIRAVVGQQITVKQATKILTAMVADQPALPFPGPVNRLFPTLLEVADRHWHRYRGPIARVTTLRSLHDATLTNPDILRRDIDPLSYERELLTVPGIGPWTAAYVAMRAADTSDVLLPGDAGVRAGAKALGITDLPWEAGAVAPYRSYLTMLLWAAAADAAA